MMEQSVLAQHLGKEVRLVFPSSGVPLGSVSERGTLREVTSSGVLLTIPARQAGAPDVQRFYPWTAIVYVELLANGQRP